MNIQSNSRYHEVHARSLADPEGFWGEAAREIDWIEPARKIFDPTMGLYGRWFAGAVVNTCYNALDRHVAGGRADQVALIHDSPLAGGVITKLTYAEMLHEVKTLAAVMVDFGVAKGDRVILYMPMVPEAVVAMLACARIGAVHSVVFGGFAAKELATRIDDAKPKLIFSASCGLEPGRIVQYKPLLDEAITLSSAKPQACIILQRPQQACELIAGRDHDWAALRAKAMAAKKSADCVPVLATDPLYILYTSGTTGVPKGVVRDNGGHLVALKWSMFNLYGVKPGEVWWCGSDIGWVVGHSYIVYGPLIHGATSIMYEGKPIGTPDAGAFWRLISEHKAVALFTAPTAFRAIRKEDPDGTFIRKYDLSKFRTLFLAGERADPPTVEWAEAQLKVPVIDHWWQTETGWCIAGNPVGLGMLPVKHGSPTVPMPGYQVDVVDEATKPVPAGTMGSIVIKLPMPPACLPTLWEQDERFKEVVSDRIPRLLQNLRRRLQGRGRLCLGDGPHRRHHQRRRPPAFHRRHGGDSRFPSRRRRMRGARHQGRHQGRGALRLPGAEGRRGQKPCRDRKGDRGAGARQARPGRGVQARDHGGPAAEDALRQDPARHHQEDRRRRTVGDAGHHRGSQGAGRNRRRAEGKGVSSRFVIPGRSRSTEPGISRILRCAIAHRVLVLRTIPE